MSVAFVKRARQSLGMSQKAFALATGRSYSSIRVYEAGRKVPSSVLAVIGKMCEARNLRELATEAEKHLTANIGPSADASLSTRAQGLVEVIIRSGNTDLINTVIGSLEIAAHFAHFHHRIPQEMSIEQNSEPINV